MVRVTATIADVLTPQATTGIAVMLVTVIATRDPGQVTAEADIAAAAMAAAMVAAAATVVAAATAVVGVTTDRARRSVI